MTRGILSNIYVITHTTRHSWCGNNYNYPLICIEWPDFVGHQQEERPAKWVTTPSVLLGVVFFLMCDQMLNFAHEYSVYV